MDLNGNDLGLIANCQVLMAKRSQVPIANCSPHVCARTLPVRICVAD